MKTFILHDESVNSYGFRMLTNGVVLDDFKKNPVMFYNHDDREMPIGRWENIRIEDGKILAEANFDQGDPRAKEIARKVEEGYISACSVGAWVLESTSDASLYIDGQDAPTVTKWSLREVSICNIPANHNALALYDASGLRVQEADIPTILELTDKQLTITGKNKKETMNQVVKTLLNLSNDATIDDAIVAIRANQKTISSLSEEVEALRKEKKEAEEKKLQEKRNRFEALLDQAIKGGSLMESQKESMTTLFDANPDETLRVIEAMPKRRSVTEQLTDKKNSKTASLADKSWDELDKLGKLAELRANDPTLYQEKYNERFNIKE